MKSFRVAALLLLAGVLLSLPGHALASPLRAPETLVWTGAVSGDWSDSHNWSIGGGSGRVPASGDILAFPNVTQKNSYNDIPGLFLYQIGIGASGYLIHGEAISLEDGLGASYASGSSTISLDITIPSGLIVNVVNAGTGLILSGVLDGDSNLTKQGAGTLEFSGGKPNDLGGLVAVTGGTLNLSKNAGVTAIAQNLFIKRPESGITKVVSNSDDQFSDNSIVEVQTGTVLDLNGTNQTFRGLDSVPGGSAETYQGIVQLDSGTTNPGSLTLLAKSGDYNIFNGVLIGRGTITVTTSGGSQHFGYNLNGSNTEWFNGQFIKNGEGYMSLASYRTNSPLTINGGTVMDWYDTYLTSIIVHSGGTLDLGPGNWVDGSPRAKQIMLEPGATLFFDMYYKDRPGLIITQSTVSLNGATFKCSIGSDAIPQPGEELVLIRNEPISLVAGTFKDLPDEGIALCYDMYAGQFHRLIIHYQGGDGNDVTLTKSLTVYIPQITR